jgi:hypothetical protein
VDSQSLKKATGLTREGSTLAPCGYLQEHVQVRRTGVGQLRRGRRAVYRIGSSPTLSLAEGETRTKDERCEIFAEFLLSARTEAGRSIGEVLDYVLWGDRIKSDCAERVWEGATDPAWKLPHLGISILGEMVGYARPDDFPPRNNRAARCLHALGFEGINFQ